jgi:hypothetical protein
MIHEAEAVSIFIKQMRDMGAVHVVVDKISVTFAGPLPSPVAARPVSGSLPNVSHIGTPRDNRASVLEAISDA